MPAANSGALAHVISAEAAVARGAPDAAAAHVDAAAARIGDARSLDAILAGIAARAAWPWEGAVAPAPAAGAATTAPRPAPVAAPRGPPAPAPPAVPPAPAQPAAGGASTPAVAAGASLSPSAASLLAAGTELLDEAPARAAIVLALALRADRAAAEAVLAALDAATPEPDPVAALAFVRAEALRAAGRHDEARIAYASAERLALGPAETGPQRSPQ